MSDPSLQQRGPGAGSSEIALPRWSGARGSRVLAAAAWSTLSLLAAATPTTAQVSPGPLARPHGQFEGTLKCFTCHGSKKEPMAERCLDCHRGVAWLRERARGLHGQPSHGECATCHPDHAGAGFAMIQWKEGSPDAFDHRRAGWSLLGKHATLKCAQCHRARFRASAAVTLMKRTDPDKGWLGLETACQSCHEDSHRGALGTNCTKCHDHAAWKPARSFDHAKTAFPLLGRHAKVECAKCHLAPGLSPGRDREGRPVPVYKPVPHGECSACHRDPHEGRLGPACKSCHVNDDFRRVPTESMDHARTRYPLQGSHRDVACVKCHDRKTAWGPKPPHGTCDACHKDAHAGKATLGGKKVDCASCHLVESWKRSRYTVAQHAGSAYPLEGRHEKISCDACHVKEPSGGSVRQWGRAGVLLRPAYKHCADCHRDAHGGQLTARPDKGACESCHGVQGWKPSLFTVKQHQPLKLPLEGAHARVPCAKCHGPERPGLPPLPGEKELGRARVAMRPPESGCVDCHHDPHGGRYGEEETKQPSTGGRRHCLDCHDVNAFHPSRVDIEVHSGFGFRLEGAHRAVPCQICHKELEATAPASVLRLADGNRRKLEFRQNRTRCEECHKSPHGQQFLARADRGECSACHGSDSFRPAARFDHDRDATFPLKGEHSRVACSRCHEARVDEEGGRQIIYRPVPARCADCHKNRPVAGQGETEVPVPSPLGEN